MREFLFDFFLKKLTKFTFFDIKSNIYFSFYESRYYFFKKTPFLSFKILHYLIIYDIIIFSIKIRKLDMEIINDKIFDQERALYGSDSVELVNCRFDGVADGESALKESSNIKAENCFFNLRYPFWHDSSVIISNSEMTEACRAPLWYSSGININNSILHGVKALRECEDIFIENSDVESVEFGWFSKGIRMFNSVAKGEYFMLRAEDLELKDLNFTGKYSFQYIKDAVLENCVLDTKDAFWHARNVVLKNCVVKGEYLAWYSENVTFENCVITGTQPLCYCKGLKLINCEMHNADLAFERSEVDATVTTPMVSIKNPLGGKIIVPAVDEVIKEYSSFSCEIVFTK